MKLIVVRHAETVENTFGVFQSHNPGVLSETGKVQAEKLAKRLLKEDIDVVYSSDLGRCKETLAPFLKLRDVPVVYTEELREWHFGVFTGRKLGEFYGWLEERGLRWNFDVNIPSGENYMGVLKRVRKFLDKLIKKHKGGCVLVVTHGAVKVAIMLSLFNKPVDKENYRKYKAANTALTVVEVTDKGREVKVLNSLSHLE